MTSSKEQQTDECCDDSQWSEGIIATDGGVVSEMAVTCYNCGKEGYFVYGHWYWHQLGGDNQ